MFNSLQGFYLELKELPKRVNLIALIYVYDIRKIVIRPLAFKHQLIRLNTW